MRFLQPHYLNLMFLLIAILLFWLYHWFHKRKTRQGLGIRPPLRKISRLSSFRRDLCRFFLLNIVLAALVLALAQPQRVREKNVPQPRKMDIVFLLDSSPSMWAEDIRPTRLARASQVIADFSRRKLPQDRIGLVSFSGGSLILSYLTEDPSNILYYLEYLQKDADPLFGTNIGRAIKNGLAVVTKELDIHPESARHTKVFILLSDGEDHAAELQNAVQSIKKLGIKVHTIGVASREGAPIPVAGRNGDDEYLLDRSGNPIMARLDEKTLAWIARETGGKAYRSFTGQELDKMFAEIVLREREIEGFKKVVEHEDLYPDLLLTALGAFFFSLIL